MMVTGSEGRVFFFSISDSHKTTKGKKNNNKPEKRRTTYKNSFKVTKNTVPKEMSL